MRMRKRSRSVRRPANVVQFRGYEPRPQQVRRKAASSHGPFLIVVLGLIAGGLIGVGLSIWIEAKRPGFAKVAEPNAAPSLCIGSVHDGDTIRTCAGERVRIENIDAPELPDSPKCTDRRRQGWCDYGLAVRSRNELASFLKGGHVAISRSGTDRYGRTLARLLVDGRDAGDHLVELGLARPWQ